VSIAPAVKLDVYVQPDEMRDAIARDVRAGLTSTPKELPPKWFYDERGSKLFDRITRLPEYYPTRREREILRARAGEIATAARADTLIELGSGTSEKTRILLDAMRASGDLQRFVPFDVSEETLREAAQAIAMEYPGIAVHAIAGDFERHLGTLPREGRRMIAFLGGTVGNFTPEIRARFLHDVASQMRTEDTFLLGTDLVKDVARLEAAYDDAAGVTAEFNKNILLVINRELDADFDVDRFEHVARFDADNEWVEMRLRARVTHDVHVRALDLTVTFAEGEEMRTEISSKFRRERLEEDLSVAGLALQDIWTDARGDYALSLWRRSDVVRL
jgi:L-histidine N-alpha-methyltransferase